VADLERSEKPNMRHLVFIIALLVGGWLSFDGVRAFTKGDYVTTRAGELGPWSRIVSALGVNPRGTAMKSIHVALGLMWLASAVLFFARVSAARSALIGCSVLTLWYLPLGTILSVAELILLFLPVLRASK
jgi:hypothetical protein